MNNKEKNFVSAVVYVYNSENTIESFLISLISVLEDNYECSEIICVNDHSNDASAQIIREVSSKTTKTSITLINMSCFHGLEVAMNAGVDLAIGDFVYEFDYPFMDYNPEVILNVYDHALEGFDIVCAAPNRKERLTSKAFYSLFERYSSFKERMQTESFRILSRRVINRVSSMNKTVPYRKALYMSSGLKTDCIVYDVLDYSRTSQAKCVRKYRSSLAINSILLFTDLGYRVSKAMAFLMIIFLLLTLIYCFIAYIFSNPVEGWTSTILFLSVAFFGLFVILTIVIKYLQMIVELVFKRQNYNYESIEKLTK